MINKILRRKRIIAFLLIFTLSFGVISDFRKEETQAFVIVDDLLLWTLGALVLATGVVAVSGSQINDMGQMVVDRLNNLEQDLEYIRNGALITGVKLGNNLKSAIDWVAEHFPTVDKSIIIPQPIGHSIPVNTTYPVVTEGRQGIEFLRFSAPVGTSTLTLSIDGVLQNAKTITLTEPMNFTMKSHTYSDTMGNRLIYISDTGTFSILYQGTKTNTLEGKNVEIIFSEGITNIGSIETIPYSNPLIKENYNPTYTNDNLTLENEKEGYIPIPQAIPTDVPISTEMPLNWDTVKEHIQPIPLDNVEEGTGELEIPDVDVPEGLNLWEWLKSLLMSIINFLKAILTFLLDLVKSLIDGITSLLSALFVPTVAISDLFGVPSGTGFAALTSLFNWDSIWNIQPKPYKFKTDMVMNDLSNTDNNKTWNIEVNLFDNPVVENNINLVRNVLSYSILLSVIYFIVYHFLPQRDMD